MQRCKHDYSYNPTNNLWFKITDYTYCMPKIESSHYEVIFTAHSQIEGMAEIKNRFEQAHSEGEGLAAVKKYINKNPKLKDDKQVKLFLEKLNMRHQIDVDQSEINRLKEKIVKQKKLLVHSKEKMQGTLAILHEVNDKSKHWVSCTVEINECLTILNDLTESETLINNFSNKIDSLAEKFEVPSNLLSTELISVETQPSSLKEQQAKLDELEVEIAEKKSVFLALSNQITSEIYDKNQSFYEKVKPVTDKLEQFIRNKNDEIEEAKKQIQIQTNQMDVLKKESSSIDQLITETRNAITIKNNFIKNFSEDKKNYLIQKKLNLTENIDQEKTKLTTKKTEFISACNTLKEIIRNQIEKRNQKINNNQKKLKRAKRIIKWSDKEDKRHFFIPTFIVNWLNHFINDIEKKLSQEIDNLQLNQQSLSSFLENHSNSETTQLSDIPNLNLFPKDSMLSVEENIELDKKLTNFNKLYQEINENFSKISNFQTLLEENEQAITKLDNQVIESGKEVEELLKKEKQLLIEKEKNENSLKEGNLSLTQLNQKLNSLENDKKALQTPYTTLFDSINPTANSPLIELLYAPIEESEKLNQLTSLISKENQNFHDPVIKNNISANPIYHAVNQGTAEMLNVLLNALPKEENKTVLDAIAHYKGNEIQTALHRAIELHDLTKINLLVEAGADINLAAPGKNGMTPLLYAYTQGKLNLVNYFMAQNGIDLNAVDAQNQNLMHWASRQGDQTMLEKLLAKMDSTTINQKNIQGQTALTLAVMDAPDELKYETLQKLIQKGAKSTKKYTQLVNDRLNITKNVDNFLHRAILDNDQKLIRWLMNRNLSTLLNNKNSDGLSPLALAVRCNLRDTVGQLLTLSNLTKNTILDALQHLIKINNPDEKIIDLLYDSDKIDLSNDSFPLLGLCLIQEKNTLSENKKKLIHTLIEKMSSQLLTGYAADLFEKLDAHGNNLFHLAVQQGDIDIVSQMVGKKRQIFRNGNSLDQQNKNGDTALHFAITQKNDALITLLLSKGANPNVPNQQGKTAFSSPEGQTWLVAEQAKNSTFYQKIIESGILIPSQVATTREKLQPIPQPPVSEPSNDNKVLWDEALASKNVALVRSLITKDVPVSDAISAIDFNNTQERQFWLEVLKETSPLSCEKILYAMDKNGNTLLHAAVLQKDEAAVSLLIQQGVEINLPNQQKQSAYESAITQWKNEKNALFNFFKSNEDYLEYRILVQLENKLNSADRQDHLQRYQTIIENQARVMSDLAGSIAKLAADDSALAEIRPLIDEAKQKIITAKGMLKTKGKDTFNPRANTQKLNEYTKAIEGIITQLKEKIAELTAEKARAPWYIGNQTNALHRFVKKGELDETLWDKHSDRLNKIISAQTDTGHTPLQLAVAFAATGLPEDQAKSLAMVKVLVAHGADLNARGTENKVTDSALHIAVKVGAIDVAAYLLAQPNIKISLKDNQGKTALDLLAQRQDETGIAMTKLFLATNRITKEIKKSAIQEAKNHKNEVMIQLFDTKSSKKETPSLTKSSDTPLINSHMSAFARLRAEKKQPGGECYPGVFSKIPSDDAKNMPTPDPVTPAILNSPQNKL